ncbi:MAG: hypothetical protein KGO82_20255, partial [Bacteroidota bacterium]|nr:hypothetical protein [Bacteroidota bacterium]
AGFLQGQRYFDELSKSNTTKNILLTFFTSLGLNISEIPGFTIPPLLRLIFQHYASRLDASNLIDSVALSEQKGIREYAPGAAKNYLGWLAAANSVDVLEKQDFGAGITPPNQLLYLLARKALLEQIHQSSAKWLIKRNFPVEASMLVRNFHNIRPEADLTKWEVMKAPVKVAEPEHPKKELALGAYLWTVGINEEEAAYLKEVRQALDQLKDLPTARLERCFTEHIDTCAYRLDAWQMALFKMRLAELRQTTTGDHADQQRRTGIYLGAYGWLENVRPSPKQQVPSDIVPEPIRPANGGSLYIEKENGGFVHAPSLNHAAAASVLRSGYLAHAGSATPDTLAVNLSSERVRRALFILEGMQNGQSLEALLGYQFERGLHDRASANNQLLKLNGYIYDFRAAFDIQKNMVKQQGDNSATVSIPATGVVNGVALAEYQGSFPFGAKGGVESASAGEQLAINAEKDRLADTLDAVKDLLTSESVYQLVLGNFDRASAVLNAMQEAKIPPVLDVIDTPRSSHFTFTNRVTIQFEKLDPALPASNPWPTVPMTDRAVVEPGLNKWAAGFMPEAAALFCRVAHSDATGNELDFAFVNATDLRLQPLDYLYILGNELNTGSNTPGDESKTGASELEMRIAAVYRQQKSLPDEQAVQIQFL